MRLFLFLLLSSLVFSCTSVEVGKMKDVNPDAIYFDYSITGEEGKDVACVLRYRFGGPNGTTLVLEDPAKVEIDGTTPALDSAKYTGAYYELTKPVMDFAGHHTIIFSDINKKQYKEEFDFIPFTLSANLPEKIKRDPFVIKLKNFPLSETPVRLVMTDTAFSTPDVNEVRMVVNGEVSIDLQTLKNLKQGPISLEIYTEEERPVKNGTKQGGKISITYSLKREFELVDSLPDIHK